MRHNPERAAYTFGVPVGPALGGDQPASVGL